MIRRQAMEVSINELRKKADELEDELLNMNPALGKNFRNQKCQVPMINRHNTSDQWKFE